MKSITKVDLKYFWWSLKIVDQLWPDMAKQGESKPRQPVIFTWQNKDWESTSQRSSWQSVGFCKGC
jgi:hypothetical protein